jgi:hypothetical protein
MAYCAERDEEFHVSTVLVIIHKIFLSNFIATFLILVCSNGISIALKYSGIILVGPIISLQSFLRYNYPLIIFSDVKAIDAIKYSFQLCQNSP